MHCTDEDLLQTHSAQTRLHVASCESCQQRLAMLQGLRRDADVLPVMQPSAGAWDKIRQNLPTQAVSELPKLAVVNNEAANQSLWQRFKLPMLLAASFIVGILVTKVSHQVEQLGQLDEQIALSRQYESQLVALRMTSPLIEAQLWQISEIDQQLNQAQGMKERQQLWRKRNEILLQMLTLPTYSNEMI